MCLIDIFLEIYIIIIKIFLLLKFVKKLQMCLSINVTIHTKIPKNSEHLLQTRQNNICA